METQPIPPATVVSMGPATASTEAPQGPKTVDFVSVPNASRSTTLGDIHEVHPKESQQSLSDTATDSSEEFWDDAAKADSNLKSAQEVRAKRGRRLYLAFMRLYRPFRVFLIAIIGSGILITPFLVFRFSFPDSVARPHVVAWSVWLTISWACGAAISILTDVLPRVVLFLTYGKPSESFAMELELFMAVTFWLKTMFDVATLWITLSVMRSFLNPPGNYWVYVNRAVSALYTASVILLIEKCFLRFVGIRFHRKALADRLIENKLALTVLDKLANQPVPSKKFMYGRKKGHGHKSPSASIPTSRTTSYDALNNMATPASASEPASTHGHPTPPSGDTIEMKEKGPQLTDHPHDSSKSKEEKQRHKAMTSIILDQVGDAIGAVALKDSKFNKRGEFGSMYSARKLARQLFAALSDVHPSRNLVVSDFHPYFRTREEAEVAFQLIDKDGNGDIEKREMREAVQRIYRERKVLTASLKDISSAIGKLDGVLLFVAFLAIAFASLLIFDRSNTLASLVPLATVVLGFSFIFGHSAQTLFESLIFIFSTHVFDVGDLVMIDDQVLLVREFGLFSTTFRRVDGQEIIAPNALLANHKLIFNLRRSGSMWESTVLNIDYDTSLEAVEQLKTRLKAYVAANKREWLDCAVMIDKMEYQNAIFLTIAMQHKSNWQDWGGRWERRTVFMRHLKTVLEELEIGYRKPLQPVLMHPSSARSAAHSSLSPHVSKPLGDEAGSLGNAGGFSAVQHITTPGLKIGAGQSHF